MIHRPFSTGMVDLLFGTVVLLMLLINPPIKQSDTPALGEYKIEMAWDDDRDVDMDIYVGLPNDKVVWFGWKNHGFAYVTRDDQGKKHGLHNFETVWLDTPRSGEYCISVHNYAVNEFKTYQENPDKVVGGSVEVRLTDDRSNVLYKRSRPMPQYKAEVPYFCFVIADGHYISGKSSTRVFRKSGAPARQPGSDEDDDH